MVLSMVHQQGQSSPAATEDRQMSKFEIGATYFGRFITDADSRIELTVAARTAKSIVTDAGKMLRIKERDGVEYVMPFGRYSMAPSINADRRAA